MKSAIIVATFVASLAVAKPIMEEKRYMVTETITETATVTVTGARKHWGPWQQTAATSMFSSVSNVQTSSSAVISSLITVLPSWPSTAPSISSLSSSPPPSTSSSSSQPPPPPSSPSLSSPPSTTLSTPVPVAAPPSSSTTALSTSIATRPASTSASSNSDFSYSGPILLQHNYHRKNHSAPDINWDDGLASIAQQIASSCVYAHNLDAAGGGYGQNIGAGAPPDQINRMITDQMYNDEMMLYPGYGVEPDMGNFEAWGHFSQIVWKETTSVGCYTQYCPGGLGNIVSANVAKYFTVCNYKPAGNMQGSYGANVGSPLGQAAIFL